MHGIERTFRQSPARGDRARTSAPAASVHAALGYIGRLYDVEDEAESLSPEDRLRLRQEKSLPILNEFHEWLLQHRSRTVPQGPLGEAITYTLNQWESLCLFTTDGDIPTDNNRTEHALRQQVLGRLNWLFVGSQRGGGGAAAVLYTLVATCKRLRIDPLVYLQAVFTRLPENLSEEALRDLLPDRWIQQHPQHRLAHRERQASQAKKRRRQRRARRRAVQNTRAE